MFTVTKTASAIMLAVMASTSSYAQMNHDISIGDDFTMVISNEQVIVFGKNDYNQLGLSDKNAYYYNPPSTSFIYPDRIGAVSAGSQIGFAYAPEQKMVYKLGRSWELDKLDSFSMPAALSPLPDIAAVSSGSIFTAFLTTAGTVMVHSIIASPNALPTVLPGVSNITKIDATGMALMMLDVDGNVWIYGRSGYGGLFGITREEEMAMPMYPQFVAKKVTLPEPIVQIAEGSNHFLAVAASGKVYGWGDNNYGQLAVRLPNSGMTVYTPIQISGLPSNVIDVAAARYDSIFLASGKVYAAGQTLLQYPVDTAGTDPTDAHFVPFIVPGLPTISAIYAGFAGHIVKDVDGKLYGWGWNVGGNLGVNANQGFYYPKYIPLPTAPSAIEMGYAQGKVEVDGQCTAKTIENIVEVPVEVIKENTIYQTVIKEVKVEVIKQVQIIKEVLASTTITSTELVNRLSALSINDVVNMVIELPSTIIDAIKAKFGIGTTG